MKTTLAARLSSMALAMVTTSTVLQLAVLRVLVVVIKLIRVL